MLLAASFVGQAMSDRVAYLTETRAAWIRAKALSRGLPPYFELSVSLAVCDRAIRNIDQIISGLPESQPAPSATFNKG